MKGKIHSISKNIGKVLNMIYILSWQNIDKIDNNVIDNTLNLSLDVINPL